MRQNSRIILSVVFVIWFVLLIMVGVNGGSSGDDQRTASPDKIVEDVNTTEDNQGAGSSENNQEAELSDQFIKDVKTAIQDSVGENESIQDVTFENEDLCVYVNFNQVDPAPLTLEDLAISRTSSITDAILTLTQYDPLWNTITVDFGELGQIQNSKDDIQDNGYGGRYFQSENFILK